MLRNPSNTQLALDLGLRPPQSVDTTCDLIVVGAGPAGLASGVYGFPAGLSGAELAERATIQAEKFGAQIMLPEEAVDLEPLDGTFRVALREGGSVIGRAVVLASGVRYRRLPVARLEELEQSSVYYAATQSEAQLCRNHPVVTVGGGNSAGQGTLFLSSTSRG